MIRARPIAELVMREYAGELPVVLVDGSLRMARAPDGGLILRGSDDAGDWVNNGRLIPRRLGFGDSWRLYHGGFIASARAIFGFIKATKPPWLAGHSAGAPPTAIVGAALGIKTVCFAQPRCLWLSPDLPGAKRWVTSYCRADDVICSLPPRWLGFRHIGYVKWARTGWMDLRQDHSMARYLELFESGEWT